MPKTKNPITRYLYCPGTSDNPTCGKKVAITGRNAATKRCHSCQKKQETINSREHKRKNAERVNAAIRTPAVQKTQAPRPNRRGNAPYIFAPDFVAAYPEMKRELERQLVADRKAKSRPPRVNPQAA